MNTHRIAFYLFATFLFVAFSVVAIADLAIQFTSLSDTSRLVIGISSVILAILSYLLAYRLAKKANESGESRTTQVMIELFFEVFVGFFY